MVKVEMEDNKDTGITAFIFTTNDVKELEVLDKLKVAILGDHERIGSFISSSCLVIKTRVPSVGLQLN